MSTPGGYPPPGVVATRVLEFVRTMLVPGFADALARQVSTTHGLAASESEVVDVARQLPDASADRTVADLDLVAAELLARRRADDAVQGTLSALGARGQRAAAQATTRDRAGGAIPRRPPEPPAVSRTAGATGGAPTERPTRADERCAVASVGLAVPDIHDVDVLAGDEDVLAAAVLATVYQCGDRMQAFRAVDVAVRRLDDPENELCVDNTGLLNALSCWHEIHYRVRGPERATLVAKILGLSDPHLPGEVAPDPLIQPLLNDFLEAINAACDPGPWRVDSEAVHRAAELVRARISSSVTTGSILKITQLQVQYEQAQRILSGLARYVCGRGRARAGSTRSSGTGTPSEWVAVDALLGRRLPDGTDLFSAHATAAAWQTVFDRLSRPAALDATGDDDELCAAAALLRPGRSSGDRWCRRTSA